MGLVERPGAAESALAEQPRRALKTLLMPGGLGSTHKVLILGKGVGAPALRGCSFGCGSHDHEPDTASCPRLMLDRARDHDRVRGGDARADRAVLVVEHADRVDRLHPLRRRGRLPRARRLVAPLRAARVRAARARLDPAVAGLRGLQPRDPRTGTTSACPRTRRCATSATPGRSRPSGRRSSRARS